ncbi:MAG TPA: hypothetical protein VGI83_00105, partial [Gemmatimonadales bacterium]
MTRRAPLPRPATAALAASLLLVPARMSRQGAADPIFAALDVELARATTGFARGERPAYFVSYEVTDHRSEEIAAQNGGITAVGPRHERLLDVDLRVGNYTFDNTHRALGGRDESDVLPLDDDAIALRTAIWLSTEDAYRTAVEDMIRLESARSTA